MMNVPHILIQATLTFLTGYALVLMPLTRFELPSGMIRFHLGLLSFLSSCVAVGLFWCHERDASWIAAASFLWTGVIWWAAAKMWHQSRINAKWLLFIVLFTALLFLSLNRFHDSGQPLILISHFLSAFVLAATTYGMCLGHGYLNHPGLSFEPLLTMGRDLIRIVIFKAIFSTTMLITQSVSFEWGRMPLYTLMLKTEGLGISLHYVFGVVMPFFGAFLVMETLRVHSNQSATGILYVLMTAALIAEGSRWVVLTSWHVAL